VAVSFNFMLANPEIHRPTIAGERGPHVVRFPEDPHMRFRPRPRPTKAEFAVERDKGGHTPVQRGVDEDPGGDSGAPDGPLDDGFVEVVPPNLTGRASE